jgi:hypothetical protein
MKSINHLLSSLEQWADRFGLPSGKTKALCRSMRQVINNLRERDASTILIGRDFEDSEGLECEFVSGSIQLFPTSFGRLAAITFMPEWKYAWKWEVSDEVAYDIISDFFHFASQYIARARHANMLGALAAAFGRTADFRGNRCIELVSKLGRDEGQLARLEHELGRRRARGSAMRTRSRHFAAWARILNCLDPHVHRAVFQFVRAIKLMQAGFPEESIMSVDGLASVACQLVIDRRGTTIAKPRGGLATALKLSAPDQASIDTLYELRCNFGAHPAQTKWWDFAELYEDEIEAYFALATRLLRGVAVFETSHRAVNPEPASWSEWFTDNALWLWDAVWFHRLPA